MTVELMSSAYPCVPVKMEVADVSHSPWEKCIYSLTKKSKLNFEKHFYEIILLRENSSSVFLHLCLLVQMRGRRQNYLHPNVFVQQNGEKHILGACFLPSTFT